MLKVFLRLDLPRPFQALDYAQFARRNQQIRALRSEKAPLVLHIVPQAPHPVRRRTPPTGPQTWLQLPRDRPAVINWQFTTNDARIRLSRLYPPLLAN
jgi:hypothetical protein